MGQKMSDFMSQCDIGRDGNKPRSNADKSHSYFYTVFRQTVNHQLVIDLSEKEGGK